MCLGIRERQSYAADVPDNASFGGAGSQGANTVAGPAINTKQITTQVLVENGGTVVIGGIYEQTETDTTNKVPLLGDIPVVGFLFKNNIKIDNKTELLVFISPRIIKDTLGLR